MRKTTKIRLFGERLRIVQDNSDVSIVTPQGTLEYNIAKLESDRPSSYISQQLAIHQTRARIANEQFEEYKHEIPPTIYQWLQPKIIWFFDNIDAALNRGVSSVGIQNLQLISLKSLQYAHHRGAQTLEQACLSECSDITSEEFSSLTELAREMSCTYSSLYESVLGSRDAA